ncbi:phage major capsid protein [Lacticaseibacillus rhamnosus]|uniref:phage major capsid protein n=1 Tax=Lacticaseibacillus rhamnosus TaxID=47715 RepID=UPI00237EFC12|nr:phage major capsid protein [Lacticaseibacillus rhamnosus]MDE3295904.1 phage major capsid protein [Lacticaseibacillus rhamnosus]
MTIKFGDNTVEFKNFEAKQKAYAELSKKGGDADAQADAFGEMMNALSTDSMDFIKKQVDAKTEDFLKAKADDKSLTQQEIKFFNDIKTDTQTKGKDSVDVLVPKSIVDRIFDGMTQAHPLLQNINLTNNGMRLKFLKSNQIGTAVWGDFMGEIQGQLDAKFGKEEDMQNKLTAFVVLPNDLLDYGASYLKTYIITQLKEAFAVEAEKAYLLGDGAHKPVGLNRDLSKGTADENGVVTYAEKASAGTLTFANSKTAAKEIANVIKKLSVDANGKPVVANGNTIFVMAPGDHLLVEAQFAIQNLNGQFVTSYPFGITIIESVYQPEGKVTVFVKGRYDAFQGGSMSIKQFDQTLAMQDAMLWTAKQFFYGKARDNNATAVYTLDLADPGTTPTQPTTSK